MSSFRTGLVRGFYAQGISICMGEKNLAFLPLAQKTEILSIEENRFIPFLFDIESVSRHTIEKWVAQKIRKIFSFVTWSSNHTKGGIVSGFHLYKPCGKWKANALFTPQLYTNDFSYVTSNETERKSMAKCGVTKEMTANKVTGRTQKASTKEML